MMQQLPEQHPMRGRMTRESPPNTDIRIIGVELTLTDETGRTEELAMFACQLTLADIRSPGGGRQPWKQHRVNITLHTSEGDRGFTMPID